MLTKDQARAVRRIRRAITSFDETCQNYAFKGAAHPDSWDDIESDYILARRKIEKVIGEELGVDFRSPNAKTLAALEEACGK